MDEVDRLRDLRARFVSAKDAGEFLGVAKKQFLLLIECGFVQTASEDAKHPLVDGGVDLLALIALVDGIRDKIAPAPPNGVQVRFRDLNLRRTTNRKALFQLLRQIRDCQIRPVAASKDDPLADFAFCGEEVDRFIKGVPDPAPLTARDVAELTGWKHECMTHWCKEGLLKSSHGRRGVLIPISSGTRIWSSFRRGSLLSRTWPRDLVQLPNISWLVHRRMGW